MLNNPAMAAIVDLWSTQQWQTIYNHPMNIHESIELSQVYIASLVYIYYYRLLYMVVL
jgi:hypothetical protein